MGHAQLFTQWKHGYEKEYETIAEEIARFNIWKDNLEKVMEHNARYDLGLETFYLGMNIFADMRGDEFVAQRNGYKAPLRAPVEDATPVDTPSLPSSVDWRDQGWVTPIKDQGQLPPSPHTPSCPMAMRLNCRRQSPMSAPSRSPSTPATTHSNSTPVAFTTSPDAAPTDWTTQS